jgi:hypothetical protein
VPSGTYCSLRGLVKEGGEYGGNRGRSREDDSITVGPGGGRVKGGVGSLYSATHVVILGKCRSPESLRELGAVLITLKAPGKYGPASQSRYKG